MSADIANTTLASAPYFDDFNEDKKFHRVLFRPSFPVQARELTQLQSILQNQIERFGDSVYKTGSIIKGCAPTVIPDANYFVVPNAFDVSNTSYENAIAYGATTGVQARILKGISGFVDSTSPPKFIVKYTTVGANGATQFLEDEVINIYDAGQSYIGQYSFTVANTFTANTAAILNKRIRGQTSDARGLIIDVDNPNPNTGLLTVNNIRGDFIQGETIELVTNTALTSTASVIVLDFSTANNTSGASIANTVVANSTTANGKYTALGNAYAISVSQGIVYQKGFFIKTDQQILVLNSSAGGPSAANNILVGIETAESVVDEFADNSLYDNSGNISNEAAPGAHRLKLDTTFVKYDKGSQPDEEIFFAIGEFGSNNILRWNTSSFSGRVNDELAQRTYDESGHYTVKDFTITTKPSANTEEFEYVIGDGKAYVRGNPIKFDTKQNFVSRRGTDTESPVQQIVSMNYGNYANAQEVRGYFSADESVSVDLYDTFQNAITTSKSGSDAPSGNTIGTANIRNIVFDENGDPKGSPDARYKFYLFNIKMDSNKNFTDVRSVVYSANTNRKAFADIAVSDEFFAVTNVAISAVGGGYVTGDTVVVTGGSGESVKLALTVGNTAGNVTAVSIVSPGRYDVLPSANASAILSTTGGTGTGLTVVLTYDGEVESELKETSYSPLVFGLSNRAVKNLKDADGDADTRFYYNLAIDSTLANTGSITLNIPDGGSFFGFSDAADASENKIDLVLYSNTSIETIDLDGTVSVNTANSPTTITGSGTYFQRDFVVGEKISIGGNTAVVINSIASNTSMTTKTAHPGANASSNTYKRVHDGGSAISLATSNRIITLNSGLQSLTIDLGPDFTFSGTKDIKARVYARKVNARPIAKVVKRNQKVRFYNGTLTGTITSTGNSVTGTSTTFDADIKVGNYIRANGQTRKVTAKSSNTALSLDTAFIPDVSSNTFQIVHPYGFNMGVPDVFKINRISNTDSAESDNDSGYDWNRRYTVDFGQRDTHYDHAVIYPKSTTSISNTYLLVDFDCFEANAAIGKGFFSVESYNVDDSENANTLSTIKTWEIPTFYSQARQRDFDLRDSIDFRPYRANTANVTANSELTTLNPPPSTSFNTATTDYNPFPGQNFECNLTYYLPRRDALVLTSKGEFRVIEGTASLQPRSPSADSETQMVVATTYIPPYPSLTATEAQVIRNYPYTMKVSPTVNKRFTMKDISVIEQRVSSLEYFTTLTRLEQKATQLNIPNAEGIDRFKNGIFVDPFDNHNLARINDNEHQIVIDPLMGVGRPKVSIETVKLELDSVNGNSKTIIRDSANNIAYNRDFLTVDYVPNTVFLEQAFATREIPIDSDDRFLYGTVDLDKEIFSDVEQFRTYPNREYGVAYDSYETNTNYTVELIYPNTRTIKILARGLKPNAKHYIGVDGVDYSAKAVQGFIQIGADEIAENIVVDGIEGQDLYADSNGRLYAIVNLPGTISLGSHLLTVSDVVASAISNGFCSSRALGSFVVNSVDDISDYPPEPQPPPAPKVGVLVADFDVSGSLVVIEGTTHNLSFLDKTNRGIVATDGTFLETPVSWEWTFVQCSTGCVDSSLATSALQNPEDIEFTYATMIETVHVKLKVTGSGGTVSEVTKPIQLTKYQDNTAGLKLSISAITGTVATSFGLIPIAVKLGSGSVLKAAGIVDLLIRADMTSNRVSGGFCRITITGNKTSGSLSGKNYTATNIGVASNYTNDGKSNGGREVGFRWKKPYVEDTTLTIVATYEAATGQVLDTLTKTISWTSTGTIAPCKPCPVPEITPISRAEPCSTPEVRTTNNGTTLVYHVC